MLINYFSIFIFIALSLVAGLGAIFFSILFGAIFNKTKNKTKAKCEAYECGIPAFSDARMQFKVRYYRIAIFFIIFDIEMAFLFPWAVVIKRISWTGIIAMGIFLGLLVLGLIYEWRKGALEWD